MALFHASDPTTAGVVELDQDNRVMRFVEKPSRGEAFSNLGNASILVVQEESLELHRLP
jgi:mannose-1-phosphate guanylyltransferase